VALATSNPSPGRDIYICKKAPALLTIHISLHAPSASSRGTAERARVVRGACWRRQSAARKEEEAEEKGEGDPRIAGYRGNRGEPARCRPRYAEKGK